MANNIREPIFAIDAYKNPWELEGADSWACLVCQIIFLEKNTYTHSPDMGIGLHNIKYVDLQKFTTELQSNIVNQTSIYLRDVPLTSVNVSHYYWEDKNVDVIIITLSFNEDGAIVTRAIYVTEADEILTYVINKFDSK